MKNVGTVDKVVRILIALTIGVLYFTQVITGTTGLILFSGGSNPIAYNPC